MKICIVLAVYLVAAFLTGSNYVNHRCALTAPICSLEATYAGIFWPVYWGASAGLEVTR